MDVISKGATASDARGAGCGCKLPPDFLRAALRGFPAARDDPRVLVGHDSFDDGAAYALDDQTVVVGSLDFFTPIVADPEIFGAIAATNALSDIFAMGARPLFAMAIACHPRVAGPDALAATLRGGARVAAALGCPVLGGHSIDDPETKYGLAVVGACATDELLRNDRGRAGDRLVLTKPLGTGIAVNAGRSEVLERAVATMLIPNAAAAEAAREAGVAAATDVTGFGLLGHLHELALASGLGASISRSSVPLIDGVEALAREGKAPGGEARNRHALRDVVITGERIGAADLTPLFDPQTSGGMLLAVADEGLPRLSAELTARAVPAHVIGRLVPGEPGVVNVVS